MTKRFTQIPHYDLHFWFSEKQKRQLQEMGHWSGIRIAKINGNLIEYTHDGVVRPDEDFAIQHRTTFDDMVYLGTGTVYSINGFLQ